jgi:hypothetical protein
VLIWNAVDLGRKLEEFRNYYNENRVHQSLSASDDLLALAIHHGPLVDGSLRGGLRLRANSDHHLDQSPWLVGLHLRFEDSGASVVGGASSAGVESALR